MSDPAAWIPSQTAALDLRTLARNLGLIVGGERPGAVIAGPRRIRAESGSLDHFPASMNAETGVLSLPPLYVDFADWFFFEDETVASAPSSGTHWCRMKVTAQYDLLNTITGSGVPVNVTVSTPIFEWHEESTGTPSYDPDPPVDGAPVDYFFYLVKITDRVIVQTRTGGTWISWYPPQDL